MTAEQTEVQPQQYAAEEPVSISHFVHVLQRYAGVIVIALVTVTLLYIIAAAAWWLMAPSQRVTSMPFRLEFKGAETGQYPNGLRFSTAEITTMPILLEVHRANNLAQFIPFQEFSRSVIVLESNPDLERLMSEYQAKLADRQLTPVDRERLQQEFESRRASISKADHSIQFAPPGRGRVVPPSVASKILHDTLRIWASRAALEKRVLDYQISVLTPNVLAQMRIDSDNYLVPLLLLRKRLDDLKQNVGAISTIPGAQLVRTTRDRASIAEIDVAIDEIVRFRLEPLMVTARSRGLLGSGLTAMEVLRAQLAYDERLLEAARRREDALRRTLAAYESQQANTARETEPPPGRELAGRPPETVMPQLSESFLERIVDLSSRNADREFRQRLTEEIKQASLAAIPAELAVQYDRELIESFGRAATTPDPTATSALQTEWTSIVEDVKTLIAGVNEIYSLASRQLYPETQLYRTLGPAATRTQRGISLTRIAVYGILTFVIALPLAIIAALLHNKVKEEESRDATAQTT